MTDTPQVLLAHHLKALKLPTFLREYDKLARQCAAEGTDYPRYLLRLAELELSLIAPVYCELLNELGSSIESWQSGFGS